MSLDLRARTKRAYRGSEARLARWAAESQALKLRVGEEEAARILQREIDELFK